MVVNKAPASIPIEYSDFADVFFLELVSKFLKYTRINDHAIELVDNQQPPYSLIYSLGLVELEILKSYIKINLANSFIRLSKSIAGASIFFDKKSNKSFQLCIAY